jgi:hypothetical protein
MQPKNLAKGHRIRLVFGICLLRYIVTTVRFRMVLPSYSRQGNWKAYEFSELLSDRFENPVLPNILRFVTGCSLRKVSRPWTGLIFRGQQFVKESDYIPFRMRVRSPVKGWTINPRRWCHDIVPKLLITCTKYRKSWTTNTQWRSPMSQKNRFSKYLDSTFRRPRLFSEHIISSSLFTNIHSFDSIISYERH